MKIIATIFFLVLYSSCFSQDTAKVEQYCSVDVRPVLLSRKVVIQIDYGAKRTDSTDAKVKDEKGETIKFNSFIDAMNYMGKMGWEMVTGLPHSFDGYFFFKRKMIKSEADKVGTVPVNVKY